MVLRLEDVQYLIHSFFISTLPIKHMKAFFRKKISTSQAQFGQNKGFGQKVQCNTLG